MDERRGQAGQVGVHRGEPRVGQVGVREAGADHVPHARRRDERVEGGVRVRDLDVDVQVGERGERGDPGRAGQAARSAWIGAMKAR